MARAHALVSHLSVRRGGRLVLDDISFSVGPGITAILGPNGAGKTTLIEALASPSRDIGLMPQRWRPLPGFTVRDSVAYAGWLKGLGRREIDAAISVAVDAVDLRPLIDRRTTRLSGGEQQRVGLAESIVHSPSLLLLDEPTVGLDPEQRSVFRSSLQAGLASTVLLSTHLIDDVAAIAENVVVIDRGGVAFAGTLADLADHGESGSGTVVQLETAYRNVLQLHRAGA